MRTLHTRFQIELGEVVSDYEPSLGLLKGNYLSLPGKPKSYLGHFFTRCTMFVGNIQTSMYSVESPNFPNLGFTARLTHYSVGLDKHTLLVKRDADNLIHIIKVNFQDSEGRFIACKAERGKHLPVFGSLNFWTEHSNGQFVLTPRGKRFYNIYEHIRTHSA